MCRQADRPSHRGTRCPLDRRWRSTPCRRGRNAFLRSGRCRFDTMDRRRRRPRHRRTHSPSKCRRCHPDNSCPACRSTRNTPGRCRRTSCRRTDRFRQGSRHRRRRRSRSPSRYRRFPPDSSCPACRPMRNIPGRCRHTNCRRIGRFRPDNPPTRTSTCNRRCSRVACCRSNNRRSSNSSTACCRGRTGHGRMGLSSTQWLRG